MPSLIPVIVGLSGGVDSSVAALLLQRQGYRVSAAFMKNWEEEAICPAERDYRDACSVAQTLGIPLRAISFADIYWDRVFSPFLDEHRAGRTPNPDVACNREVKFSAFFSYALQQGAECIATGHYARIRQVDETWQLLKGADPTKDQSYFLYSLGQEQLSRVLFPVGDLLKTEVRRLATEANLVTQDKKDSTGICFIGERPFREFLARYLPPQPGLLVTEEGEEIGQHDGLMYYTLGQRHGLRLGGKRGKSEEPWYVARKEASTNTLVVVQGQDHPSLYHTGLIVDQVSWTAGKPPMFPMTCHAKTRYRQSDQSCLVTEYQEGQLHVLFSTPQRAITPGQSVVFYQNEECLGGGIIEMATD
ncbi:tRNA-specific 2-thiouridylase [Gammaproteobacteria bacterium]